MQIYARKNLFSNKMKFLNEEKIECSWIESCIQDASIALFSWEAYFYIYQRLCLFERLYCKLGNSIQIHFIGRSLRKEQNSTERNEPNENVLIHPAYWYAFTFMVFAKVV